MLHLMEACRWFEALNQDQFWLPMTGVNIMRLVKQAKGVTYPKVGAKLQFGFVIYVLLMMMFKLMLNLVKARTHDEDYALFQIRPTALEANEETYHFHALSAEGQVLALVDYFLKSFYERGKLERVLNIPGM
jgi:hypothetical protein